MLENIKPLVDLGLSIILLHPKSKRPFENNWTKLKTKSYADLRGLYRDGMNLGVRTGEPSKLKDGHYLAIIDCDVKSDLPVHQKEMQKALDSILPSWEFSPKVVSGRNRYSLHIYAKTQSPCGRYQIAESTHKVRVMMPSKAATDADRSVLDSDEIKQGWRMARAWEISFYGSGAQAVIPPSIHPDSGREYSWEVPIESVDDLPVFVPNKIKPKLSAVRAGASFVFIPWSIEDMTKAGVSPRIIDLITKGHGMEVYGEDRSSALFAAINALEGAGLRQDLIISIMTDDKNPISEKALEKGDRITAARWLLTQLNKVINEKSAASQFEVLEEFDEVPLTDAEVLEQGKELIPWRDRLDRNQHQLPKNTSKNRRLILENVMKKGTICFNDFTKQLIYKAEPPWRFAGEPSCIDKEPTDTDLTKIKVWFQTYFKIDPSEDEINKMINLLGRENMYHPIREHLDALVWDGIPRLDRWLFTYLEAVGPEKYIEAIGRKTLIGAVARIYRPGTKFDYTLVLEGGQNVGKSSTVKLLSAPWDSEVHIDPSNKDTVVGMMGAWIIELSELVQMYKHSAEQMKSFLSRCDDRVRLPYGRRAETYPRHCIFIGTTNQDQYLQDETGNRRFWPVRVGALDREKFIEDRDQLFAEAVVKYFEGEKLWLDDKETEELAKVEQMHRYQDDEWMTPVAEHCEKHKTKKFLSGADIFSALKGLDGGLGVYNFTKSDQMRIAKIMTILGYKKARKRLDGVQTMVWERRGL